MNVCFYVAIDRLPLGTVAAIEFLPVIALAAVGMRTARNALALATAAGGSTCSPTSASKGSRSASPSPSPTRRCSRSTSFSPIGSRDGRMSGIDGLGAAMLVAVVAVTPIGVWSAAPAFVDPIALAAGIGVGICSSVIPYVFDQLAMARLSRATYSLMVSLLPTTATLIGIVVLAQFRPGPRSPASRWWSRRSASTARPEMDFGLGSSGLKVSRIGLGMMSYGDPASRAWHLGEREAEPIVRRAVEAGVTFFDTADMYSEGVSEEITGRLLEKLFTNREDYVLATKVYFPVGAGPNDAACPGSMFAAIDASLARLGLEHVDLYQIHRWDSETPIEETMEALLTSCEPARLGTSAPRACTRGSSPRRNPSRGRRAGRSSSRCRTTTTSCIAREEREMIPLCVDSGVGSCPTAR